MSVLSETVAWPPSLAPVASAAPVRSKVTVRSQVTVPLRFADGFSTTAQVLTFRGLADGKEHLLFALGEWEQALLHSTPTGTAPLVRLHSECLTGDVFGSERCDCGPQLREAVEQIAVEGGFLLYLRQEGRGIGLYSKLDAYALQDDGLDTYEANLALGHGEDERDYTAAAQMLFALGAGRVRLLSNNPDKAGQLTGLGIDVAEQVPTGVHLSAANHRYLASKRDHTGHTLNIPSAAGLERTTKENAVTTPAASDIISNAPTKNTLGAAGKAAPRYGLAKAIGVAAAGSIAANAVIASVATGLLGASSAFQALTVPVLVLWTIFGVAIGALGWRLITRRNARPARLLRWLVPAVLVLSFIPDVLVLATNALPGTSATAVFALMAMHVAVAAIAVPSYQRFLPAHD